MNNDPRILLSFEPVGRPIEQRLRATGDLLPRALDIESNGDEISRLLAEAAPSGFNIYDLRPYGRERTELIRGLPTDHELADHKTRRLYVVWPQELATRELWGNELHPDHLVSIRDAWTKNVPLHPVKIDVADDGAYYIEDGNHRVTVATERGIPVVAIFRRRRVSDGWQPQSHAHRINDRVADAIEARKPTGRPTPRPRSARQGGQYVANPAWATAAIADAQSMLETRIPLQWLPRLRDFHGAGQDGIVARLQEYGCGVYGCVYPTHDESVVMKLTTDDTEVQFASNYANALPRRICVEYHHIVRLARKHRDKYGEHNVHLLWRDSAEYVGRAGEVLGAKGVKLIEQQFHAAQQAYRAVGKGYSTPQIHAFVRAWLATCEAMARQTEVPALRELGDGMVETFADQRILFGDVHINNIGLVQDSWVITDPGNIAVIEDYD